MEAVIRETNDTHYIPPVLVGDIDGELSLIDGHSRIYVAHKNNFTTISAIIKPISGMTGPEKLYRTIHKMVKDTGVKTISCLENRILSSKEHEEKRIGLCREIMEETF